MTSLPSEANGDERLLQRVQEGDVEAIGILLARHRERLRHQVAGRLDPAIHRRVDASDVVQETLITASRRIDEYLERKPMPFDRWLWKTALERLIMERRKHFEAVRRTVTMEIPMSERSSLQLAQRVQARDSTPSQRFNRKEAAKAIRQALAQLPDPYREVVIMRWIERLSYADIALVLEIEEPAARQRHGRALIRLHGILVQHGLTSVPG
jgi:RNA polymerase sigma-70 factor (ECF subfamily)